MTVRNTVARIIAIVIALVAPMNASAQTSDSTKACYVPTTGSVYRIGVAGTPATCRAGHGSVLLGVTLPAFRQLDYAGTMLGLKNVNATGTVAYFESTGNAHALRLQANSTAAATIHAENTNTGTTSYFKNSSTGNGVTAINTGGGAALFAQSTRIGGPAAHIENLGAGAAIFAKAAGGGNTINAENSGNGLAIRAVTARTDGGPAGHFEATTVGSGGAIFAKNSSNFATVNVEQLGTGVGVRSISALGYSIFAQTSRTDAGPAAHIENLGTGSALFTKNNHTNTTGHFENIGAGGAIYAKAAGNGTGINVDALGNGTALRGISNNGYALMAQTSRPTTIGPAAHIENFGLGGGVFVKNTHENATGYFENAGGGIAINAKTNGATRTTVNFENTGGGGAMYAVGNSATAPVINIQQTGAALGLLVTGRSDLNGNTTVNGNLQVNGNQNASGTKSAVVSTSGGKRLMYTEEATEVWFTDYGFGTLVNGEVFVAMDPTFAETANLDEPYHVFIQAYGPSELYVTERTASGFRVKVSKGESGAEFSYRIVAKRLNYERDRLERAN